MDRQTLHNGIGHAYAHHRVAKTIQHSNLEKQLTSTFKNKYLTKNYLVEKLPSLLSSQLVLPPPKLPFAVFFRPYHNQQNNINYTQETITYQAIAISELQITSTKTENIICTTLKIILYWINISLWWFLA